MYNIEELKAKTIGTKIRQAREKKGKEWSQKRLAIECGLSEESRQTVAAWEKGTKLPTFEQMLTLCNIFNVEITYFLGDDCTNHNWEYIHQETGLSEAAIEHLNSWITSSLNSLSGKTASKSKSLKFIEALLEYREIYLLANIYSELQKDKIRYNNRESEYRERKDQLDSTETSKEEFFNCLYSPIRETTFKALMEFQRFLDK